MRSQRYSEYARWLPGLLFALIVPGTMSISAWAQSTPQLVPARFTESEGALTAQLEMPPGVITGDNVVGIPCQAIVEPTGEVKDVNCFTDLFVNRPYVREILDAASEGTISPALVSRLPVRVLMNFTVLFVCKESDCTVAAIPHHNVHSKKYGLNYFAPQPILADDSWYPGFDEKMAIIRARGGQMPVATGRAAAGRAAGGMGGRGEQGGGRGGMGMGRNAGPPPPRPGAPAYIISVKIDESGVASRPGVDKNSEGMLDEAKLASDGITSVSFITGYVEGKPAEMEYQEYGMVNQVAPANFGPLNPPR